MCKILGEPNNAGGNATYAREACAEMYNSGTNYYGNICFNDIPCGNSYGFVCEYSMY